MNYTILIIIAVLGIAFGMWLVRGKRGEGAGIGGFVETQMEQKAENKQKILQFVAEKGRVQNDDVERLVGVSNATAERYLDELEREGKLVQQGALGQSVFYTLK